MSSEARIRRLPAASTQKSHGTKCHRLSLRQSVQDVIKLEQVCRSTTCSKRNICPIKKWNPFTTEFLKHILLSGFGNTHSCKRICHSQIRMAKSVDSNEMGLYGPTVFAKLLKCKGQYERMQCLNWKHLIVHLVTSCTNNYTRTKNATF